MAVYPYNHPRWHNLRRKVLEERPTCEDCRHEPSAEVDHIKPVRLGGEPFERDNLQARCKRCHSRKTRIEQGEAGILSRVRRTTPKVKGCDVNGMPLDPEHPWNQGS